MIWADRKLEHKNRVVNSQSKELTLFTCICLRISHLIDNDRNDIDYCPNNSSLDCYTQNVVLDIFEEIFPARSFLIVVNVVLRLFNPAKNYILKPRTSFFVPIYRHMFMTLQYKFQHSANLSTNKSTA